MSTYELRTLVMKWAKEAAQGDLAFSGNEPFKRLGIEGEAKEQIKAALLFYAETAAHRTVSALKLHGHLVNLEGDK